MAQFHVYRIAGAGLVLDLQTDIIDTGTRIVAPLLPQSGGPTPLGRLEPILEIGDVAHVLHTAELAAVPSRLLKEAIADLSGREYEIKGALDMVFSGF